MLRDEMVKYEKLTGEDATHVPIMKIGAYLDGYDKGIEILDKIRAEIDEQYDRVHPYNLSCAEGLEMALGIIDKYKAESEDKK